MGSRSPLVVLSNARIDAAINYTTLREPFLEPLAEVARGRVVTPPPLTVGTAGELWDSVRTTRSARSVFWMQSSSRPELALSVAAWSGPHQQRAAAVIDAWAPQIDRIGWLAVVQRLRPLFVFFREGHDELIRRFPRGCFEHVPFAVDTSVFRPGEGERDIFAYWMGRRYEPLHLALESYCRERELRYVTTSGGEVGDPAELGRLVARSRYFVVTPPDLDNPGRTGGFSPLVMRYLEGLAAGARLLGVRPRSGEFEELIPSGAMLEVAPDGSDLVERLDSDAADPGVGPATAVAGDLVRSEHSWSRRAEQVWSVMQEYH